MSAKKQEYAKVKLRGMLAADVELRDMEPGEDEANFPLAVSFERDGQDVVDYHRVVVTGKDARLCERQLSKGSVVQIVGELRNRSFDDKNGMRHYRTEILADGIVLVII